MNGTIVKKHTEGTPLAVIVPKNATAKSLADYPLTKDEKSYVAKRLKTDGKTLDISILDCKKYVVVADSEKPEKLRNAANSVCTRLAAAKKEELTVFCEDKKNALTFLEGLLLSAYKFDKYKTEKPSAINAINLWVKGLKQSDITPLRNLCDSVCEARNWVNEPIMVLNADAFANILQKEAVELGIDVKVLKQKQIESLKMGGLLGVNRGSVDEARFITMEWKPKNAVNKKPIALVGKGIMYDTGGLNIKTSDYMYDMKSDMAGAATMAATLFAVAKNQLPVHVVVLIPATDNRPCGIAYANGDILRMYDGTMVEVVNTDAEGRLILADAIAYANRFKPQVIVDAATLTGAAERAIGKYGIVAMHQDAAETMEQIKRAGDEVYERIAEFPFWDEYGELIKSDVADIKNSGAGPHAGMITAGKFVAHFAKAPFVHLDIAGVAFADKSYGIYGKGATGFGVRLLYRWLEGVAKK